MVFKYCEYLNFTINSFDIVAVFGNKVKCCFDEVERCLDIVAGVDVILRWTIGQTDGQTHGHLALTYIALLSAHCAVKTERDGSIQLGREEHMRPLNHTGLDCANRRVVVPSGE